MAAIETSFNENATGVVYDFGGIGLYTIIPLLGDYDKFKIGLTNGELRFKSSPDFENPTDGSFFTPRDNIYEVKVSYINLRGVELIQTLKVTINDVNEFAPVADETSGEGLEDGGAIEIILSASDDDGAGVVTHFNITEAPEGGVFKDSEGNVIGSGATIAATDGKATIYFHPDQDKNGVFDFAYTASDGDKTSEPAGGTITVTAVPDAPTAKDIEACGLEDEPLAIVLMACDPDAKADIASFKLTSLPTNGAFYASEDKSGGPLTLESVIIAEDGQATVYYFANDEHFHGEDAFAYNVVDSTGAEGEGPAGGVIEIKPVNDAPVAADYSVVIPKGSFYTKLISEILDDVQDVDDEYHSFQVISFEPAGSGVLEILSSSGESERPESLKFTPNADFNGVVTIRYMVSDHHKENGTDEGAITINVSLPTNPAPGPNEPTPNDFDGFIPALVVSSFIQGEIPDTMPRLESLANFAEFQFLSYQERGVADPALGPYEALGLGFSETTEFQDKYGALTEGAFITEAYEDVFGRAATTEQADHFQAQIDYFEALYASVGIAEDKAEMMAKGAALGQMLGFAVLEESETQPYLAQAQAFLADAADGVVEMGKPLAFYELN